MVFSPLDIPKLVEQAESRIRPFIRKTILEPSAYFSQLSGANVYFKCDNLQHTGSFKVRGALSKVLSLSEDELKRGVVTASTGNHGAAVAYALSQINRTGTVFVPTIASKSKVDAIKRLGAEVRYFAEDSAETEAHARQYASQHGAVYVSPYNDPLIIAGQGTLGIEIAIQLPTVDAVFTSLGGGGLISGVAGYLKSKFPNARVVGCSPENSQVMIQSIKAGEILDLPSLPTISDGTAGGVETGSITFPLCRDLVDNFVTVTEEEIISSLKKFISIHHMLIEGSAAVAIAALLKNQEDWTGKNVVIVLCGANISMDKLKEVL